MLVLVRAFYSFMFNRKSEEEKQFDLKYRWVTKYKLNLGDVMIRKQKDWTKLAESNARYYVYTLDITG
jgi:hypothetical protein